MVLPSYAITENYELAFNSFKQIFVNNVTLVKSKLKLKVKLKQNPVFKVVQNQNVGLRD